MLGPMDDAVINEMQRVEKTHWWFRGKRILVTSFFAPFAPAAGRPKILNVGCGTGATSLLLEQFGETESLDSSPLAVELCTKETGKPAVVASVEELPYPDESFDVVAAFDVLEHVDDERAIAEIARVTMPGGTIWIAVPAFPSLWSSHDEAGAHLRRYTKRTLLSLLRAAGLDVRRVSFTNVSIFPAGVVTRPLHTLLDKKGGSATPHLPELPAPLSACLVGTYRMEAALLRLMNMPFGLSLYAACRKR